jgi:hypothetical protein
MGWMWRLRIVRDERLILGSPGAALRTLGSARREAVRQPAGVADVQFQGQKPPQKRGRGLRVTAGLTDRHTCESLRPRNPSLLSHYPGNGITVFTPGEAMPTAH